MIGLIVAVILGILLIGVVLEDPQDCDHPRAGHRRADADAEQVRDEADPLMGYTDLSRTRTASSPTSTASRSRG
jgi:hypothetical protein